jgi:hypothetical protein
MLLLPLLPQVWPQARRLEQALTPNT